METPSSTRRVTRSQTLAALNNSNIPLSKGNKEKPQERSALIDITNDSPIVGLAMETPSSAIGKQRSSRAKSMMMTPGSGEALLRGQVKTLLQKVEEEAEVSKVTTESRPFLRFQAGCGNSPMGLMAPTPANTPLFSGLCEDGNGIGGINNSGLGPIVMALPVVEQQFRTSEVVSLESQRSVITRSLLLDFSEQSSESGVTDQGKSSACKEKASSIWSIQVNASVDDEDDEEPIEEMGDGYYEGEEEEEEEEEEDDDDDGGLVDELCEGLSKISMKEMFRGRHTRFVYNSDDEGEEEEEEEEEEEDDDDGGLVDELCEGLSKISMKEMFRGRHTRFVYNSDDEIEREEDMIRLKGLPTPKGKHLRFPIEEEEDA